MGTRSLHSKMIVQSCITPPYIIQVQGLRMIVLSSCYEDFLFITMHMHPYIALH